MSKRHCQAKRRRYLENHRCEECGQRGGRPCYLPEPQRITYIKLSSHGRRYAEQYVERSPDEWLCFECAPRAGYCRSCGDFWGGICSFEFIHPGLCDHCADEIRSDEYDFEEEEQAIDEYWDDPDCAL